MIVLEVRAKEGSTAFVHASMIGNHLAVHPTAIAPDRLLDTWTISAIGAGPMNGCPITEHQFKAERSARLAAAHLNYCDWSYAQDLSPEELEQRIKAAIELVERRPS